MELDFDKYCVVDGSPTTVLPSPRRQSKVDKRKSKGYAARCGNGELSMNEKFNDISFHRYRSASCKTISSRRVQLEYDDVRKRGSVYQSSKEVRLMRKTDAVEGRQKIELSERSVAGLSLGVIDSLCSSDEDNLQIELKRSSVMSRNSELSTATSSKSLVELHSCEKSSPSRRRVPSYGSRKVSFDSDRVENQRAQNVERPSVRDFKINSQPVIVPLNNGNSLGGKEQAVHLRKSLSAKLALPHSPARSESDSSRASSPKARFGPVRKVFDPFVKSKSHRSPLSSSNEQQREAASTGSDNISRNKTFCKPLMHDFSNTGHQMECESWSVKECHNQLVHSSPAHLQALLKLDKKHGMPTFEFTVKFPEDVFVAKAWKVENSLNWTYTFHSTHEKRRSNASGRGSKDSKRVSPMVGQMQVSCHLCTELKDAGTLDNSLATEFILYDVAHPRRSVSSQDNSFVPADVAKAHNVVSDENSLQDSGNVDEVSTKNKARGQMGQARFSPYPLDAAGLHPYLEAAAIVIQIPFEKRESLKFKSGEKKLEQPLANFLYTYEVEQRNEQLHNCSSPAKVNVVIPSGNHSLPTTAESRGPSPLLDRWRLGGGCDCGGWDMACPLNIFGNPDIKIAKDQHGHFMENNRPLELFIQVSSSPVYVEFYICDCYYMIITKF